MILESGDDNKNYTDFEGMLYSILCQIKWGFNAKKKLKVREVRSSYILCMYV